MFTLPKNRLVSLLLASPIYTLELSILLNIKLDDDLLLSCKVHISYRILLKIIIMFGKPTIQFYHHNDSLRSIWIIPSLFVENNFLFILTLA